MHAPGKAAGGWKKPAIVVAVERVPTSTPNARSARHAALPAREPPTLGMRSRSFHAAAAGMM